MALPVLEIIKKGANTYGHLDGYLYVGSYTKGDIKYWKCRQKDVCSARLTTVHSGRTLLVRKGGTAASHSHASNPEEVAALRLMGSMKRAANEHPERPPSAVMRIASTATSAVQAQLPEKDNMRKAIQRERAKNLPANPTNITELANLPDRFRKTNAGDAFLIYDSFEDENYDLDCGRILVFSTRENLKILFASHTWHVDGTFKVTPSIFFQLFSIMGTVTQRYKGTERPVAIPLVHALLETKQEKAYTHVFVVTRAYAAKVGIITQIPEAVMSDFELAIINSVITQFGTDVIRLCLFHLCQSVFRNIQAAGLQSQYSDENDSSIRVAARTMCALAFVPPEDVVGVFDDFFEQVPEEFLTIANYFEVTYVRGITARGRRRAVKPRYEPKTWNQYASVMQGRARTNNASEGWHNRFQLLVGRAHPSLYNFLNELQKEQADIEYMLRELRLGKKVAKLPSGSLKRVEDRIVSIVADYQSYVDEGKQLEYITALGHNIRL